MLYLTDETRSLLRMIHRYQVETMDSFAHRKAQLDDYDLKKEQFLQRIELAQKKYLDAVSQSFEESKTAERAIKSIRLSKKVAETKSSFFGGPKKFEFPGKDRLA